MTWRERSTSTCLPCDGYLGLNDPRRASRPRTTARETLRHAAHAPHLAVGDDRARGRRVERPRPRDDVVQAGEAALDQPHRSGRGRRATAVGVTTSMRRAFATIVTCPGVRAVAGADGEAAAAGLQRDDEAAVRRAGDRLDRPRPSPSASCARRRAARRPSARDEGRDRAADADAVTAQDDVVVADAVGSLELDRHRAAGGRGSRGGRRRGSRGAGVGTWASAPRRRREGTAANRLPMIVAAARRIEARHARPRGGNRQPSRSRAPAD